MNKQRRNVYSDEEKARILLILRTNDGNISKTARETLVPRETIKAWKKVWDTDGVPFHIEELTGTIVMDYVSDAERVRDLALVELEKRVKEGAVNVKDLYMMFGILEDKITRAKGLATKRVETVVELPDIKELSQQLGSFIQGAISAASQRKRDIELSDGEQAVRLALPQTTRSE